MRACRRGAVATPAETVMKPAPGMSRALELVRCSRSQQDARAAQVGAGHEDGELVGAGAPDHVADARQATQALGHGPQRRVAGRGAAAGVERAEAVDVHQRQRGRRSARGGVGEDRLGVAAERFEGQQPGAGVGTGAVGQLGLEAGQPERGRRPAPRRSS